ncbi:hypothetical protein NE237_022663 [Protea cynaroides]|uniref:Uncharacterized protein n=1 Tax=Protea cynaroides TaxID=273540 RepID=A0A9Q0HFN7_9MAGN|nr:hypothetical protein NE237_022663 [Protea cynaroides]
MLCNPTEVASSLAVSSVLVSTKSSQLPEKKKNLLQSNLQPAKGIGKISMIVVGGGDARQFGGGCDNLIIAMLSTLVVPLKALGFYCSSNSSDAATTCKARWNSKCS